MSSKLMDCPRCGMNARLTKRSFSEQAISALVLWGDMDKQLVGQEICDSCYAELREVLIDRSEDLKSVKVTSFFKAG